MTSLNPASSSVDISVVVVGWNARHYLELCLESLRTAPSRRSLEIIVVDNASSDGSAEMIAAQFPEVKLVRNRENLGYPRGCNVGIQASQGRYVALVNPDVQVLPGCLDALADFLDQNPTVGNVGPRVFNPDMTQQSTCRRFPTLWNNFCSAAGLASACKRSRLFAGEHMWFFPHDRTINVDVLVGCFWMVRRETLQAIGLFDDQLFMYGDDVDWCQRAWRAGWKVVFFPGARAIHDRGSITKPYPVRFAIAQQESVLHYWSKYHSRLGVLGIRGILLFHHLLRYGFAVLAGRRPQSEVRKQVSTACLRGLVSGNA